MVWNQKFEMQARIIWTVMIVVALAGIGSTYIFKRPSHQSPSGHAIQQVSSGANANSKPLAASTAATSTTGDQATRSTLVSGSGSSIITVRSNSVVGKYLAAGNAHTLYVYNHDKPDESHCTGTCTTVWPPYTTERIGSLPVNVSDIKRAEGRIQYTYKGMPLYFFAGEPAGVMSGNGHDGFSVAKP